MSCCELLFAELRKQGHRLTPQREMIIEAVAHAGRHVTAEEVFGAVRAQTSAINLATVYRTLELLSELGLVSKIDVGTGSCAYAAPHHGSHCHLVCRRCRRVIEAECELISSLEAILLERYGFAPDLSHFTVYGLCRECHS